MKEKVYVDMDEVLVEFNKGHAAALEINPTMKYPQAEYGFWINLKPLLGGIEAVKALIDSDKYDVYILTAPSINNPLCYAEKRVWIEKYFGLDFVNKLIISPNKGLFIGEYLIDDNFEGKGQEDFGGELIHFGSSTFPDWKSVRNYLDF
jgi:5'(3')-deoxyribonucleotidase